MKGDLDQAIQDFESQWEAGFVADFAASLPKQANNDTELLVDLACIDLKHRVCHDTSTRVETYTTKFPQLDKDELALLELIRTEYLSRPDRGSLTSAAYCQRFPHLKSQIEMMFRLDFDQVETSHGPETSSDWCCAFCQAIVTDRQASETKCRNCGQPFAIGRYELIELAGKGAFGCVYRARDPKLEREVALKLPRSNQFLTPEQVERFLREYRNAAQLDHPGIVRVFDAGREKSVPYIVSEFVEGEPLSDQMVERDFDFREAAQIVASIATAVAHAHQRGVIHRDLKPSNVMLVDNDQQLQPRVMDFGLARREKSDVTVTIEGQAIGTPAYMSPEQARGDLSAVGVRSDVYSIGVILYKLLCGEVPFRGNVSKLIQQVINDDPPPPSRFRQRIPRDLETICLKAINRDPSQRYADGKAFGEDIQRWLDGKPILARPIGPLGRTYRWCQRHPTVAALLTTLTLTIVAGVSGIAIQWQAAESARRASEADLSDALESVDRVLEHLGSDKLVDIPQAKQLRVDVLKDALMFFQRFRQRNPDDPRLAMQVAGAHYQVARIQAALGDTDQAGKAYQAAVDGYNQVKQRAPDQDQWCSAAATAHSAYASFLLQNSDREDARQQQQACLELRKQLHERHPDSGKHAAKYASARADYGRTLTNFDDTELEYVAAIEDLETLVSRESALGYQRDLARVLNNYAIRLVKVGQNGKAEKCREQAIGLLENVIAADPTDEGKRALYATSCLQLVKHLRQETRLDAATKYQRKAAATYRQLIQDFPTTPRHRERFAKVLDEIADMAQAQSRTVDEINARQEAVLQWESLITLFPSKNRYQLSLTKELSDLAKILIKSEQNLEAEQRLRERLTIQRKITDPDSLLETMQLTEGIRELASLLKSSSSESKQQEAEALETEAQQAMQEISVEQVMATQLSNGRKLDLLRPLIRLAKISNDLKGLESLYRARIELYQDGLKLKPNHLGRLSGLADNWSYLGKTLRLQGRDEESHEAYRTAVKLGETLLEADPDSATYVTKYLIFSSQLGRNLVSTRNASEAVKVLRRSLQLAKKLFAERKNEGYRNVRVVLAYTQLGNALAIQSIDFAEAIAAYEEAVAMAEVLREQPGMERFEATVLNSTAWLLVSCPDEAHRNPKRAIELAQKAIKITPESGNPVGTLGFALYETGQYRSAIKQLNKANKLTKKGAALNTVLLASAYAKLGEIEKANEAYAKAVVLNDTEPDEPELFEIYRIQALASIEAG